MQPAGCLRRSSGPTRSGSPDRTFMQAMSLPRPTRRTLAHGAQAPQPLHADPEVAQDDANR